MCVCLLRFLNLKIQEGEAHNIFCPAFDCYQLVPVEVIESVVSREMDKRYLQFDIKVTRLKSFCISLRFDRRQAGGLTWYLVSWLMMLTGICGEQSSHPMVPWARMWKGCETEHTGSRDFNVWSASLPSAQGSCCRLWQRTPFLLVSTVLNTGKSFHLIVFRCIWMHFHGACSVAVT